MRRPCSLITAFAAFLSAAQPAAAFSEPGNGNPVSQVPYNSANQTTSDVISTLWGRIVSISLAVLTWLAIIYLIWAGIQYITAGGNAEKAKKARGSIIGAIAGITVLVAALGIVSFLSGTASYLAGFLAGRP